jgi:hypothetical protein
MGRKLIKIPKRNKSKTRANRNRPRASLDSAFHIACICGRKRTYCQVALQGLWLYNSCSHLGYPSQPPITFQFPYHPCAYTIPCITFLKQTHSKLNAPYEKIGGNKCKPNPKQVT